MRKLTYLAYRACCAPLDRQDLFELRVLVDQAFDLRDGPYFGDACAHIVDWHQRTNLRHLERHWEREAALRLLRESSHLVTRDKRDKRKKFAA